MKIIVHIGTEKTGSTSIQKFLHSNQNKLNAKGFYFLQSPGEECNRDLASYCYKDDRYDDFFITRDIDNLEKKQVFKDKCYVDLSIELANLPANIHTVISSCEHFHSRLTTTEEIQNLKSLLSGFFEEVTILTYLREQSKMSESLYSTHIKVGKLKRFSQYKEDCNKDNVYFNFDVFLTNWENVFGINNIIVKIFDKNEFVEGSLIKDFMNAIDMDAVDVSNIDLSDNESLSLIGQAFGWSVNHIEPHFTNGKKWSTINRELMDLFSIKFKGKGAAYEEQEYYALEEEFLESNSAVCKRYFKGREKLFPENKKVFRKNNITEKDLQIIDELVLTCVKSIKNNILSDKIDYLKEIQVAFENTDIENSSVLKEAFKEINFKEKLNKQQQMSVKPIISIIIPVYNVSEYIEQCLNSVFSTSEEVLNQFEIIIVNDCTPDDSWLKVKAFMKDVQTPYYLVEHEENKGLGGARNSGLDIAQGEYIAFLDSDDFYEENALEDLLNFTKSNLKADIIEFGYQSFTNNRKGSVYHPDEKVLGCDESIIKLCKGITKSNVWNKLFRACVFEEIRFIGHLFYEDLEIMPKCYHNANFRIGVDKTLVNYRVNQSSITNQKISTKHIDDLVIVLNHISPLIPSDLVRAQSFALRWSYHITVWDLDPSQLLYILLRIEEGIHSIENLKLSVKEYESIMDALHVAIEKHQLDDEKLEGISDGIEEYFASVNLNKLQKKLQLVSYENRGLVRAKEKFQTIKNKLSTEVYDLKSQVLDYQKEVSSLNADLVDLKNTMTAKNKVVDNLTEELTILKAQLKTSQHLEKKLTESNAWYKNTYEKRSVIAVVKTKIKKNQKKK